MIDNIEIEKFLIALTAQQNAYYTKQFPTLTAPTFAIKYGKKYAKIVSYRYATDEGGSAFCFIDRENGNILKAASWAAPAKHARGNIRNGAKEVGPYGPAYLR